MVFKIISFESGQANSHNSEEDIFHWESMCYGTALRFNISLEEIFSKSGCPRVMEKYDESVLMQISQELTL